MVQERGSGDGVVSSNNNSPTSSLSMEAMEMEAPFLGGFGMEGFENVFYYNMPPPPPTTTPNSAAAEENNDNYIQGMGWPCLYDM